VTDSPTVMGNHSYKAVVTDTGLYQGSDDQTVTVTHTGGAADFSGTTPGDGDQESVGSAVTFSWTADPGAATYNLFIDNVLRGTTSGTSKSVLGLSLGNHTWFVKSDSGDTTDPITFKVKP